MMDPRLLLFGFLLFFGSSLGQTFFIGLFADDIRSAFSLSNERYGYLYSLATLASAAVLPFAGRLLDRWDLRLFCSASFLGLGAAVWGMSVVESVSGLVLVLFALRFFGQGLMSQTAATTTARYFNSRRGVALSLVGLGFSLGEAGLPRGMRMLLEVGEFREVWQWLAVSVLVLFLVSLTTLRGHTRRHAEWSARSLAARAEKKGKSWGHKQVLSDPRFYLLLPALLVPPFVGTGLFFHQQQLVAQREWNQNSWAFAFVVYSAATAVASVALGPWVDRWKGVRCFPFFLLPQGLALLLLSWGVFGAAGSDIWVGYLYMAGAGLSAGARVPIVGSLWVEVYGVEHLGAIRTVVQSIMVFSTALAPGPLGKLLDNGVSFETIALGGVVLVAVSMVAAFWGCRRFRHDLAQELAGAD